MKKIATIIQPLILLGLIGYLHACTGIPVQTPSADIVGVSNKIVDIASKMTVAPSPVSNVHYSESDRFDISLLASMKGEISPITVEMNGFISRTQLNAPKSVTPTTPRIERWLWKIRESQGQVIACEDGGRSLLIVMLPVLIGLIADVIRDYVTYQPAKFYNAMVWYDPNTDIVRYVDFHRRAGEAFDCN